MKKGWYRESVRHSLAAKGVKTNYLKGKTIFKRGLGDNVDLTRELEPKKPKKRSTRGKRGLQQVRPVKKIPDAVLVMEGGGSGVDLVRRKIEVAQQRQSAREIAAEAKRLRKQAEGQQLEDLEEIRANYAKQSRDLKKELKELNRKIAIRQSSQENRLGKQADRELQEFERKQRKDRMKREAEAREGAKKMPVPEPTERFSKPTVVKFRGRDTTGTVTKKDPEKILEEKYFPPEEKMEKVDVTKMTPEELEEERPKAKVRERFVVVSGKQGERTERKAEKEARMEAKEFKEELADD